MSQTHPPEAVTLRLARIRRAVVAMLTFSLATAGLFLVRPTQAVATTESSTAAATTSSSSTVLPPSKDPFYRPNVPLAHLKPGTPIKIRTVRIVVSEKYKINAFATQILYRTSDEFKRPTAAVTTVIEPLTKGPRKLISYHAPYDTLGSQCDPSYTLRGGKDGKPQDLDLVAAGPLLAQGYTVTIPDYEGLKTHWTIGDEGAYAALDSVRASEKVLHAPSSTPVGLMGYSGGSIPTGFAADLAPTYAPELNIVGAAAGGVLVEPAHNLGYVRGTQQWASVIPALMVSYNETFHLNINHYLSPYGKTVLKAVSGQCLTSFLNSYPGLTDTQLLKKQWPSLLDVKALVGPMNRNIMGSHGVPRTPIFLGVGEVSPESGNPPQEGDGVMLVDDVAGLATQYCAEHVKTQFKLYPDKNHFQAFIPWTSDANAFMNARFAGKSATYCQGIPPGNPLTPIK